MSTHTFCAPWRKLHTYKGFIHLLYEYIMSCVDLSCSNMDSLEVLDLGLNELIVAESVCTIKILWASLKLFVTYWVQPVEQKTFWAEWGLLQGLSVVARKLNFWKDGDRSWYQTALLSRCGWNFFADYAVSSLNMRHASEHISRQVIGRFSSFNVMIPRATASDSSFCWERIEFAIVKNVCFVSVLLELSITLNLCFS